MTDDILKHFEDNLPEGTVLVPPTDDDDSDVTDVDFGDPKMMIGKGDPTVRPDEMKTITGFIRNYPYSTLTYLCRRHNWKPSDAAAKVMAFEPNNVWWDEDQFADALQKDTDRLTAEGWEPGVEPSEPLTQAQVFTLFEHIIKVELDSDWDVYDMMHRMNLEPEELGKYLVDYMVSDLLSKMKYIGGDQKWIFAPETIKNAAIDNSWANSSWPERVVTPYVHYCPSCGTFYNDKETETACAACGASRQFEPERPISLPYSYSGDPLEDLADELANLTPASKTEPETK